MTVKKLIGSDPNQISRNRDLGNLAFQNKENPRFDSITIDKSGARILGDFSNATVANRVMFQTSTVNAQTGLVLLPNGTSTQAIFEANSDSSGGTNGSISQVGVYAAGDVRFSSDRRGTGTYLPMTFYTGGSERMRIDASGNVCIGVAGASTRKLEVNAVGSNAAISIKETGTYGVPWVIDIGSANAMRFSNGAGSALSYEFYNGAVLQMSPNGIGYGTGAGGTVTQATSKSTAVTLNKPTGQITMNNAALAAGASVVFWHGNSLVSINDVVIGNITANSVTSITAYTLSSHPQTSGNILWRLTNNTAGSLSEAVVINFAIIKGATA